MNDLVTVRMTDKPLDSRRVQKAIHRLPERRPFMTTHQMAEFYGRQPKHINQQARRNPRRFPARLCFELTPEEVRNLAMQIASPNDQTGTKRDPSFYVRTGTILGFTRPGCGALAGVMKGGRSDEVSVAILTAFDDMLEDAEFKIQQLENKLLGLKGIYNRVRMASQDGWSFAKLKRSCKSYSRDDLCDAIEECLRLGKIPAPLPGTPGMDQLKLL